VFIRVAKFWKEMRLKIYNITSKFFKKKSMNLSNVSIKLDKEDFAIVFRESKVEAVVPLDDHYECDEHDKELEAQIDGTIAYIMHCLMREDWQEEFFCAVEEYIETTPTQSDIDALDRRSKFKLIINTDSDDTTV
jgi:hypothetical protein